MSRMLAPVHRLMLAARARKTPPCDGYELVSRMASAEVEALGEMYDRFSPLVYSTALGFVRDEGDAEEITESTFWYAWKWAQAYDRSRGSVEAWLTAATRRQARECLRSRHPARGR